MELAEGPAAGAGGALGLRAGEKSQRSKATLGSGVALGPVGPVTRLQIGLKSLGWAPHRSSPEPRFLGTWDPPSSYAL